MREMLWWQGLRLLDMQLPGASVGVGEHVRLIMDAPCQHAMMEKIIHRSQAGGADAWQVWLETEQGRFPVDAPEFHARVGIMIRHRGLLANLSLRENLLLPFLYHGDGERIAAAEHELDGVAERLGIRTVALFGMGSVLSAFGSAISNVVHVYESAVDGAGDAEAVSRTLREQAQRDLKAEGLDPGTASYTFEIEHTGGTAIADGEPGTALAPVAGKPTLVSLTASVELPSIRLPAADGDGRAVPAGERGLPTYDWERLAGVTMAGPALVDGGNFTWLVDPGWSMAVDGHGDAVLTKG